MWDTIEDLEYLYLDNDRRSTEELLVNACGICADEGDGPPALVERPKGRQDYLLIIVTRGKLYFRFGGKELPIVAGQAFLYLPEQPQYYRSNPGEPYETRYVHFTGVGCPALLKKLGLTDGVAMPVGDSIELQRLTADMAGEFIQRKPFYELSLMGQFITLLTFIARQGNTAAGRGTWEARLEEARKEIYWNHRYDINMEELAKRCQLSPSRFLHLFKKQYGVPPRHYQTLLRINSARSLLQSTDMNIRQVGERVGYSDQNYFSRVFKRYTGHSPGEFRK